MAPFTLFISFLLTNLAVIHSAKAEKIHTRCPPYYFCNHLIGNISFPFKDSREHRPECGLYSVDCSEPPRIQLKEGGYWYEVESFSQSTKTISINVKALQQRPERDSCNDESFEYFSLPGPSPISNVSTTSNLTLFKCSNTLSVPDLEFCCSSASHTYYYNISPNYIPRPSPPCPVVPLHLLPGWYSLNPPHFTLQVTVSEECYDCYDRGGRCQLADERETTCSVALKGISI
ncbi:hypothetical protein ABKV19_015713 [Rosa sericea]